MLRYRTFRNTDPPLLCAIWRSRAGDTGPSRPVSVELFEQLVFGKLHFDYDGLVLAFEDERPVGFAHAASFDRDAARAGIESMAGVICLVRVRPDCAEADVATGLVEQCEAYLRRRGKKVAWGGAVGASNPFYLGLYGGCDSPGVLDVDRIAAGAFLARGFAEAERRLIFGRRLAEFRAPVDRQQVQLRRRLTVKVTTDPPARSWWEACTCGDFELTRFELVPRGEASPVASAAVRTMGATPGSSNRTAAGVIEIEVQPQHRRQGFATFLLTEALRLLSSHGVAEVDVQIAEGDGASAALYKKLGFQLAGGGTAYRKELKAES